MNHEGTKNTKEEQNGPEESPRALSRLLRAFVVDFLLPLVPRLRVPPRSLSAASAIVLSALILSACAGDNLDRNLVAAADAGRYAGARVALKKSLTRDRSDRNYVLDRVRLLILTLADGLPQGADELANQTFAILRTQGLNADKTVPSVVISEGVRTWKGEPFEQALAYYYISMQKAMVGEWDNARAAAQSSLFLLKDFGENERGGKMTGVELARRAAARDQADPGSGDRYLDHGYQPVKTDFALGYIMDGLANLAVGRDDEAADNFHAAAATNAGLEGLARTLAAADYNTVLIVEFGRGPRKIAYGPDNAFTAFTPTRPSDQRGLSAFVRAPGQPDAGPVIVPVACDVNQMAASLRWNNLEDVRKAKSTLGSVLLVGGGAVALAGRNDTTRLIGLGVLAAGALMKGASAADTRHLEFTPQRVYVVPVRVSAANSGVDVQVTGDPSSRMVLVGVNPPPQNERLQLRYVRLPPDEGQAWAQSGVALYRSASYDQPVPGDDLPYILGGRDTSPPTPEAMQRYQAAGFLTDMTAVELENLYREEGIVLSVEEGRGFVGKHILEGGDSLVAPLAGTAGFARLYGQLHPPYQPRTRQAREIARREAAASTGSTVNKEIP